ncbi:MAG: VOC family protein [Opitutaceae bacterium]|nr:VOC family protein [Opitutaceae bacterium]
MSAQSATFSLQRATLRIASLERGEHFYAGTLGLWPQRTGPRELRLSSRPDGEPLLSLIEAPEAKPRPPDAAGLYHLAILLPARAQLAEVLVRLTQHHWPLRGLSDHGVSEAAYFADPEGNGLEIYADRPRESWPEGRGDKIAMFTKPLDVRDLLMIMPTDMPPAEPLRNAVIGHVHLDVQSLENAGDFYVAALGLAVRQDDRPGALFVAADGYHHHFGLNTWRHARRSNPPQALGLAEIRIARAGQSEPQHLTDPDGNALLLLPL